MANELDILLDTDPLELSARKLDDVVAYYQKTLKNYESGAKTKKDDGPKISLVDLGLVKKPEPMRRI